MKPSVYSALYDVAAISTCVLAEPSNIKAWEHCSDAYVPLTRDLTLFCRYQNKTSNPMTWSGDETHSYLVTLLRNGEVVDAVSFEKKAGSSAFINFSDLGYSIQTKLEYIKEYGPGLTGVIKGLTKSVALTQDEEVALLCKRNELVAAVGLALEEENSLSMMN